MKGKQINEREIGRRRRWVQALFKTVFDPNGFLHMLNRTIVFSSTLLEASIYRLRAFSNTKEAELL